MSEMEKSESAKNQIINYDFDWVISDDYFPNNGESKYNLFPENGKCYNSEDAKFGDKSLELIKKYKTKNSLSLSLCTISFWIKASANSSVNILSLGEISLALDKGKLTLNTSVSEVLDLTDWNYIGLIINGVNCNLYLNGSLLLSYTNSSNVTLNNILEIGPDSTPASSVFINDFHVYDSVIVVEELKFMQTTPIAVDNEGNLWCKSLKIDDNVEYYGNGTVVTPSIDPLDSDNHFEIYSNKIQLNEIKQIF